MLALGASLAIPADVTDRPASRETDCYAEVANDPDDDPELRRSPTVF